MGVGTRVVIGMDPHKRSATIEAMAEDETVLGKGRYGTDRAGFAAMLAEAAKWPQRVWAVEGCEGIGKHLVLRLLDAGETVVDVPAKLSARMRVYATGQGRKTDDSDAHSIALVGVRMAGLRRVVNDETLEVLRLLVDRRHCRSLDRRGPHPDGLPAARAGARADPGRREEGPVGCAGPTVAGDRPGRRTPPARPASGSRWSWCAISNGSTQGRRQRTAEANVELVELVKTTGTGLLDLHGIGPSGAARLLVRVDIQSVTSPGSRPKATSPRGPGPRPSTRHPVTTCVIGSPAAATARSTECCT
jgi:transposase